MNVFARSFHKPPITPLVNLFAALWFAGLWFAVFSFAALLITAADSPAVFGDEPVEPVGKKTLPLSDTENLIAAAQVQTFSDLVEMARTISARPMRPLASAPELFTALSYDDYITIRYRGGGAYWQNSKSPFLMETFHQGFVQKDKVDLFVQTPQGNQWVPFDPDRFDYGGVQFDPATLENAVPQAGHAGVKLIERIDEEDLQEMMTFLGASYFRARSHDTVYGTSARGLAVDVALPIEEEFPRLRTFWIRRPFPGDDSIRVMSMLDSTACTGAFEFTIVPGEHTTSVNVRAEIFPRQGQSSRKFAIAPLTSMWMWGDGLRGPSLDQRPHVHDSSALVIEPDQGPTIYRPLARISYPSVSRFEVDSLVGFGLVQRHRDPKSFLDSNAKYERRPTVTVTPSRSWRGGVIELLEIPGAHEGVDNIGAYWIPPEMPDAGESLSLAYRIDFTSEKIAWGESNSETSLARIESIDVSRTGSQIRLSARLVGENLADVDLEKMVMKIATVRGEVVAQDREKTADTETSDTETSDAATTDAAIDASVTIVATEDAPTEITIEFLVDDQPIAETLSYLCPQNEPEFVFPAVYTKQE